MPELPATDNALVVRTDFSDDAAWARLQKVIETPSGEFQFRAYVSFVSDPAFDGLTANDLLALAQGGPDLTFMFVVDREALTHPEHPILVLDLANEPGRSFRVVPSEMWGIENNLSIANMDFEEFADNVDGDGVFRGFPRG